MVEIFNLLKTTLLINNLELQLEIWILQSSKGRKLNRSFELSMNSQMGHTDMDNTKSTGEIG